MTLDRRNTLLFLGLTAGQGLTGCAALNIATRQPPRLFALSPKTTFEEGLPRSDAVVMVEAPSATAGLNTARIALKPEPTLLEYYAAALWIDVVPVMVQNLVVESLDASRDMVLSMMDIHLSFQSNRLNQQMRVLTVITILFMPLTVITGIYGMNFNYMPELHWRYGYFMVLGLMAAIIISLLTYFHRRRWL